MGLRDWLWILTLGTIWGCSFIFNAILIRELGPFWVSAFRVGIAGCGCWAIQGVLRKPLPRDPKLWLQLGLLGALSYALPFGLYPLAQEHLASGVAAIINALTPVMTVVVSHFWIGGEKGTRWKVFGVVFGFSGAAILMSPALASGGSSSLWAMAACLLATLCYAVALNVNRSFKHVEPTTFATLAFTGASLGAVPLAFISEGVPHIARAETWGAALLIGLLSTAFTFQVMYRILPRVGATNFATTTLIAPVSAIVLGFVFLGELIQPAHLIGMVVIFIGLLFIDGRLPTWLGLRRQKARAAKTAA
ncbi:ABC transporter permease [Devosia pacifica]|uniref:ABC transporter permease n=1 Tax=Devosia pacifica TaxID=1335967 RepID=A0A918RUP1_9HYPH|nr:DMT family transporter [Devosia pacifica]GHA11612.1 ABC transporter permease [Devosia pacifica]